jgi:hypothetical protein
MRTSVRLGFVAVLTCMIMLAWSSGATQTLVPKGGMWQSIPFEPLPCECVSQVERAFDAAPAAGPPRLRSVQSGTTSGAPRTANPPRGERAKAKELARRIAILAPGTTLGQPMADPDNPPWRRINTGRPVPDASGLALPLDDKGRAGIVARGYREEPSWNNRHGNTGAILGVKTRF